MEIKQRDISYDHKMGKFTTCIAVLLADRNAEVLKAKAAFYASVIDGLGSLTEEKVIEFTEQLRAVPF